MAQSFSELVSDHLQSIAHALRHPRRIEPHSTEVGVEADPSDGVAAQTVGAAMLSASNVTALVGGSYMVEDEISEPASYFVFARIDSREPFRFRAALDTAVAISSFVDQAYVNLLERSADEAGRGNYVMMLREGYLRPPELIKILATSDEFLNRSTRIVIVPETSQWLSRSTAPVSALEIRTAMDL